MGVVGSCLECYEYTKQRRGLHDRPQVVREQMSTCWWSAKIIVLCIHTPQYIGQDKDEICFGVFRNTMRVQHARYMV